MSFIDENYIFNIVKTLDLMTTNSKKGMAINQVDGEMYKFEILTSVLEQKTPKFLLLRPNQIIWIEFFKMI